MTDEFRVLWPDGSTHWLAVRAHGLVGDDGAPLRLEGNLLDITDRREREEGLHRMLDSSPNCGNVLDSDARIVFMNGSGMSLMEVVDFGPLKNNDWLSLWTGESLAAARAALETARAGLSGRFQGYCPTVSGSAKWWDVIVTPLHDAGGRLTQILTVSQDLTDQWRLEEQLKQNLAVMEQQNATLERQQVILQETNIELEYAVARLATTDSLTGRKNHGAFQDRLKQEYGRAVRYDDPLSVVLLDVDRFKMYNDTYGHIAGDAVLKQVGEILLREARATDTVDRYGGEEFVLILPETEVAEAHHLA